MFPMFFFHFLNLLVEEYQLETPDMNKSEIKNIDLIMCNYM